MRTWDLFFPDLLPTVPGCPEPVAEHALRRAAQDFCALTFAWRVKLDPIETENGVDEYDLPLERNTELVRIEIARLAGRDIAVATQNDVNRNRAHVGCYDGKLVIVNPLPTSVQTLELTCTLKPGNAAIGTEDFLYDEYAAAIALGAAAALKAHRLKTYSDPAQAQADRAEFEAKCARVKLKLWRGNARNTPRAEPCWY